MWVGEYTDGRRDGGWVGGCWTDGWIDGWVVDERCCTLNGLMNLSQFGGT